MRKFARLVRFPRARRKRAALRLATRVFGDERGGEVLEYVLIAGLIVVGAIATIGCVGIKVWARWNAVNTKV